MPHSGGREDRAVSLAQDTRRKSIDLQKSKRQRKKNVFQKAQPLTGDFRLSESGVRVSVLVTFTGAVINSRSHFRSRRRTLSREQPDPICLHLL